MERVGASIFVSFFFFTNNQEIKIDRFFQSAPSYSRGRVTIEWPQMPATDRSGLSKQRDLVEIWRIYAVSFVSYEFFQMRRVRYTGNASRCIRYASDSALSKLCACVRPTSAGCINISLGQSIIWSTKLKILIQSL